LSLHPHHTARRGVTRATLLSVHRASLVAAPGSSRDRGTSENIAWRRALPVYALVVAERGVKGARPADGKTGGIASMARGWMRGTGVTTASLARALTSSVDRPVVDRTKLDDQLLEFDLTWTPVDLTTGAAPTLGGARVTRADEVDLAITSREPGDSLQDPGCPPSFQELAKRLDGVNVERFACPSIYTAVEEQLGLKLEAQNAPTDVLVIESVQVPTEN
jgi:uncharacterized protein (TIGR03435 family)